MKKIFVVLGLCVCSANTFARGSKKPEADASKNEKPLIPKASQPAPELTEQIEKTFDGYRSPPTGFGVSELDIERIPKGEENEGKFRIRYVAPDSGYSGLVKEGQIFDKAEDIPHPQTDH